MISELIKLQKVRAENELVNFNLKIIYVNLLQIQNRVITFVATM